MKAATNQHTNRLCRWLVKTMNDNKQEQKLNLMKIGSLNKG